MRTAFVEPCGTGAFLHCRLAETEEQRRVGLSQERAVPLQGMLFDFGPDTSTQIGVAMTMADTKIPLAMVFIDGQGIVRHVEPYAPPGAPGPFVGLGPVRWVLEVSPDLLPRVRMWEGQALKIWLPVAPVQR